MFIALGGEGLFAYAHLQVPLSFAGGGLVYPFDIHLLEWTFDALDDDSAPERFFGALPGFYNSTFSRPVSLPAFRSS